MYIGDLNWISGHESDVHTTATVTSCTFRQVRNMATYGAISKTKPSVLNLRNVTFWQDGKLWDPACFDDPRGAMNMKCSELPAMDPNWPDICDIMDMAHREVKVKTQCCATCSAAAGWDD